MWVLLLPDSCVLPWRRPLSAFLCVFAPLRDPFSPRRAECSNQRAAPAGDGAGRCCPRRECDRCPGFAEWAAGGLYGQFSCRRQDCQHVVARTGVTGSDAHPTDRAAHAAFAYTTHRPLFRVARDSFGATSTAALRL